MEYGCLKCLENDHSESLCITCSLPGPEGESNNQTGIILSVIAADANVQIKPSELK